MLHIERKMNNDERLFKTLKHFMFIMDWDDENECNYFPIIDKKKHFP